MNHRLLDYDKYDGIAGVDEVGRGAIAGPIVAAAAILPKDWSQFLKTPRRYHQKAASALPSVEGVGGRYRDRYCIPS